MFPYIMPFVCSQCVYFILLNIAGFTFSCVTALKNRDDPKTTTLFITGAGQMVQCSPVQPLGLIKSTVVWQTPKQVAPNHCALATGVCS